MPEERRYYKKNQTKYQEIHNTIRSNIREVEKNWLSIKYNDILQCEKRYEYRNKQKKVRQLTAKRNHSGLLDTWKSTIQKLSIYKHAIEQLIVGLHSIYFIS